MVEALGELVFCLEKGRAVSHAVLDAELMNLQVAHGVASGTEQTKVEWKTMREFLESMTCIL